MQIGVPKETAAREKRVALTPVSVAALIKAGLTVLVEHDAGLAAGFPDQEYEAKGAQLGSRDEVCASSDVVVQVRGPGSHAGGVAGDLIHCHEGQILIGMQDPLGNPQAVADMARQRVTALSLEMVPRITRAQGMDVLSSMATVVGYQAVLEAAYHLPRLFPMLMTAAGTLAPARVFVVGVGVAGLQAIATAKRMGAVVEAYDVRPSVRDQVTSVGAKFVEFDLETEGAEDQGGYAKEQSAAFIKSQQDQMQAVVARNDVVITTAAIPGKKSPVLITEPMVKVMPPGSVIVDLAAERGGNCALTRADEMVIAHDVTILGPTDLASRKPYHASQMYSRNIENLLLSLIKDGKLVFDRNDKIVAGTLLATDGEVVHPVVRQLLGLPTLAQKQGD